MCVCVCVYVLDPLYKIHDNYFFKPSPVWSHKISSGNELL